MAIDYKDFMHGAALVAVADSDQFTALNKASVKYGHYVVNHDRHLFIKYSDGYAAQPGHYFFTFDQEDRQRMLDVRPPDKAFAVLVCGEEAIAGLSLDEFGGLVDLSSISAHNVRVVAEPRKSLRFYGALGKLGPIPRNAFPRRVLE